MIDTHPHQPDEFKDVPAVLGQAKPVTGVRTNSSGTDVGRVAIPLSIDGHRYVLALRRQLDAAKVGTHVVRRAFTTAALVGLGVALLLGLGIATTLLRRLRRLRYATLMLADRGLDSELATDTARDEVGDLGRAFTIMQARLREQEHARRAFVATASHELRTPLTSLRAMLELLEEDLQGDPPDLADARRQVSEARVQSDRLAGLAADLLDLSRIDADVSLRSEPVELCELARAVAAEFGEPRDARGARPAPAGPWAIPGRWRARSASWWTTRCASRLRTSRRSCGSTARRRPAPAVGQRPRARRARERARADLRALPARQLDRGRGRLRPGARHRARAGGAHGGLAHARAARAGRPLRAPARCRAGAG